MSNLTAFRYRFFAVFSVLIAVLLLASAALAQSDADAAWHQVRDCTDHVEVEIFILEYPDSSWVSAAEACLAELSGNEPDPSRSGAIPDLLEVCEGHFAANRLLTGAGGTAYACYLEVLAQDPGNSGALDGLDRITNRYARWAQREIEQRNPEKAMVYLDRLKTVNSNDPRILEIRAALAEVRMADGQPADDDFDAGVAALNLGDYEIALRIFHGLARIGNADAQYALGSMYHLGQGVPQDYSEAARLFRLAAGQGIAAAQYALGSMYHLGQGVPQDYSEAARLFRSAAEQGNADAQYALGSMYHLGQGVPQDYSEAARLFRLAAGQGIAAAQYVLGGMYYFGLGVPQDYSEAARFYRLAAEQGNADAQYALGIMYYSGEGVPQDYSEAARLFRPAAGQGIAAAQYVLGGMYYFGLGVPQDYSEAARFYRLAAEQGNADAQYALGIMYRSGEGVPQDFLQAYAYFNLSASQGNEKAAEARDLLNDRMSAADIFRAQELTRRLEKQINGN